jgi:cob(I)alamin adenosyltransferase
MKGYVQIYTGDGKGKTTAALGLSVRAAGAGLKVYIGQFMKRGEYSEIKALKGFSDLITIEQFGTGTMITGIPSPDDIKAAQYGLATIKDMLSSGRYDIVIMDEANVAVTCNLVSEQDLLDIITLKPPHVELIITGRNAGTRLVEKADLVTEMKMVKHYFDQGQNARIGIEK